MSKPTVLSRPRLAVAGVGGLVAAALFAGWATLRPGDGVVAAFALPAFVLFVTAMTVLLLERKRAKVREHRLVELSASLRHKEVELQLLASTDAQTGLLNRRAFYERLTTEFRRSLRYGRPLSLLMLDLDFFKRVNDTYGHGAGDFVLSEFADIVRSCIRETDVAARYGGEEFVVLLPEADEEAGLRVAERIRSRTRERLFAVGETTIRMTVSQGLASLPDDDLATEDLLINAADAALYAAKRGGRDGVSVAPGKSERQSA